MKLEAGKTYLSREGREVTVEIDKDTISRYNFTDGFEVYQENGRWYDDYETHKRDLLTEVVTEKTLPRKVMVRNYDNIDWKEAELYAILPDSFDSRFSAYIEEDCDCIASYYKYMKEIEAIPELTMEEVISKLGYEFKLIK